MQAKVDVVDFERDAAACAAGTITFDQFWRRHSRAWEAISRQVMRRWRSRAELDDVLQEVRLRVWRKMPKFDPSRGKTWREYLGFQGRDAAKTWVHAERGANKHGTRDKNPSRRFAPVSSLGKDGADESADRYDVPVEATQEWDANVAAVAATCKLPQDRRILEAMVAARGCIETVASQLYGELDVDVARKLILGSLIVIGVEVSSRKAA